jgi:hypothetical protein
MTPFSFRTEHRGVENVWVRADDDARPDVAFQDFGSFVSFEPVTARARAWLTWRCRDAFRYKGAIAVEPRYVMDLLLAMHANGFEVVRHDVVERETTP